MIICGFWGYLWPAHYEEFTSSPVIMTIMIVEHLLPWLSVVTILLMGDITVIEADWWSCVVRSLIYLACNITGYIDKEIMDKTGLYGMEPWGDSFWKTLLFVGGLLIVFCALYKP